MKNKALTILLVGVSLLLNILLQTYSLESLAAGQNRKSKFSQQEEKDQEKQRTLPSPQEASSARQFHLYAQQQSQLSEQDQNKQQQQPHADIEKDPNEVSVFGSQLFMGNFANQQHSGFNPNYQISTGDRIDVQLYGAFEYKETLTVDPQGNIFIPDVGPIRVLGVRNDSLNQLVTDRIRKIYEHNVNVYASLQTMQPIRVFVTGFVKRPGLYDGLSSDSPLYYLDKAGGIDSMRGSYIDLKVMRSGRVHKVLNLYDFLLTGKMEYFQMVDGDTILVGPAKNRIAINGRVDNPYQFEFSDQKLTGEQIIQMARPLPDATHAVVRRMTGNKEKSMYLTLSELREGEFYPGDTVEFTYDKKKSTIVVRLEGEFSGEQIQVLPQDATLANLLQRITLNPRSDVSSVQLFRTSIAHRQKEMISALLDNLQNKIMRQRALTVEDAEMRSKELASLSGFIENAKKAQPKGQIVVGSNANFNNIFLEDGDTVRIPSKTPLVMTHGEVRFPSVLVHDPNKTVKHYVEQSAGFSENADPSNLLVVHNDGMAEEISLSYKPISGDEIIVMPKVEIRTFQIVKDVSQVLFQLGMASRVVTLLRAF